MGAPTHHPFAGHFAGGPDHRRPRREQRYQSLNLEPGSPCSTTPIRHVSAAAFHQFPKSHGQMVKRVLPSGSRMGQCYPDHRDGHLRPAGLSKNSVASDYRRSLKLPGVRAAEIRWCSEHTRRRGKIVSATNRPFDAYDCNFSMPLDLVFCGTPQFAVPTLEKLAESGHRLHLVVTQPDRPKGRGLELVASPVKQSALKLELPISQ